MENASKALIMIGGVLLALIIIATGVWTYNNLKNSQQEKENIKKISQIIKINEQIEGYTTASKIYGSNVLSLCNLLEEYRKKYTVQDGYPEITMEIELNSNNKRYYGLNGTLSNQELLERYRTLEEEIYEKGSEKIYSHDNTFWNIYIDDVEYLSTLNQKQLFYYLEEIFIKNSENKSEEYISGVIDLAVDHEIRLWKNLLNIYEKFDEYIALKSIQTLLKNAEFTCENVMYNPENNIIYYIKFKEKN